MIEKMMGKNWLETVVLVMFFIIFNIIFKNAFEKGIPFLYKKWLNKGLKRLKKLLQDYLVKLKERKSVKGSNIMVRLLSSKVRGSDDSEEWKSRKDNFPPQQQPKKKGFFIEGVS